MTITTNACHSVLTDSYTAKTWAMEADALRAFLGQVESLESLQHKLAVADPIPAPALVTRDGDVARVRMVGPMLSEVPAIFRMFGLEAVDMTEAADIIAELDADPDVAGIRLDIDSPGGESGVALDRLAQTVAQSNTPIVTYVGDLMASAALWVGAQSGNIIAQRASIVGSIGVYSVLMDSSEAARMEGLRFILVNNDGATVKGGGAAGTPIGEAVIEAKQNVINAINEQFLSALSEAYDMPVEDLRALNTGEVWLAEEAFSRGLVTSVVQPAAAAAAETPPAEPASDDRKEIAMELELEIAKLVAEYPDHAALILEKVEAGVELAEVVGEINEAEQAAERAELEARAEAAEAAEAEAAEKLAEAADKIGELTAKVEELEAKVADAADLGGVTDPGPVHDDGAQTPVASKQEFDAMGGIQRAKFLAAGGVVEQA